MPKPRQGSEVKKHQSIRLEPEAKLLIIAKFGSVQAFVDLMIQKEIRTMAYLSKLELKK